jgi:HNH endonuclease
MRTRADSPTKNCTVEGCDRPLRARGLCSTHYNQRDPNRHASRPVPCAVCGTLIMRPYASSRQPACSVECRRHLQLGHEPAGPGAYDWTSDAATRARQAGATVIEPFDRNEVFERDGWICYLCERPVDRMVSIFHGDSPTIDHVVPLSRGGEHSMRNAATTHLRCNSSKQDRVIPPNRT